MTAADMAGVAGVTGAVLHTFGWEDWRQVAGGKWQSPGGRVLSDAAYQAAKGKAAPKPAPRPAAKAPAKPAPKAAAKATPAAKTTAAKPAATAAKKPPAKAKAEPAAKVTPRGAEALKIARENAGKKPDTRTWYRSLAREYRNLHDAGGTPADLAPVEAALVKAGAVKTGAAGQVVPFDGELHAAGVGVSTGAKVKITRPGWVLREAGGKEYHALPARVEPVAAAPKPAPPPAPATPAPVADRRTAAEQLGPDWAAAPPEAVEAAARQSRDIWEVSGADRIRSLRRPANQVLPGDLATAVSDYAANPKGPGGPVPHAILTLAATAYAAWPPEKRAEAERVYAERTGYHQRVAGYPKSIAAAVAAAAPRPYIPADPESAPDPGQVVYRPAAPPAAAARGAGTKAAAAAFRRGAVGDAPDPEPAKPTAPPAPKPPPAKAAPAGETAAQARDRIAHLYQNATTSNTAAINAAVAGLDRFPAKDLQAIADAIHVGGKASGKPKAKMIDEIRKAIALRLALHERSFM